MPLRQRTKPTYPQRGDEYEAWLKYMRDLCPKASKLWRNWDKLLDEHREKADYGLRYDQEGGDP